MRVTLFEPVTDTPAPEAALSVPELALLPLPTTTLKLMLPAPESTSTKLAADRSTLLATSSVAVMLEGAPVMRGASLTPLTVTLASCVLEVPPAPSLNTKLTLRVPVVGASVSVFW